MDLIDRYLHNVRGFLPGSTQDDIIRELGEDIRAQAADRADELGRPLTPDEERALLKKYGHPMLLAARYRPSTHLISPAVFPFYWFALKVSLGLAIVVQFAVAIAMVASGTSGANIVGQLAAFPFNGAVTLFGWITLVFAVIDLRVRDLASRVEATWDPRTLVDPAKGLATPRAPSAFEVVSGTVLLGWWLALPHYPFLVFGPGAAFLAMAPAWLSIHAPLAVLWFASLAIGATLLVRPGLRRLRLVSGLAGNALGLLIAVYLLRSSAIVMLAPGADPGAHHADLVRVIDMCARLAVVAWICTTLWESGRTLLDSRRR